ncbi:metal-sulfur cluster assembly factor [Tumebacillus permanentifrigoris]|uniref:Metal-sulfur cluster biosynthetic enzyme n=1 Tax=Tumebacillus permanentifrigoris TaxID=378543 RepID=A0A316D8P3_9BACL|nr:iron-sulfur cluster assembly protein [Tumebacillus permanentifrigoris]PWK13186.1 metal-sulfur cluster biosynthetic enzyme [Tumebacillus permanentifrigoris]
MISAEDVYKHLLEVWDPELMMDIVNLGLVYDVQVQEAGRKVSVLMTLTARGCPAFESMREEIITRVSTLPGVEEVVVDLTFIPPWTKERMSEAAQTVFRYLF